MVAADRQEALSMYKLRMSNIELLRIICMILIIAHHAVIHGGAINLGSHPNWFISLAFVPGGKIAFDAFLAISMWFLVDGKYKTERAVKIWLESLFYSVLLAFVSFYWGGIEFTEQDALGVLLPITGNVHGFAAAYIIVYALTPFFQKATKDATREQVGYIVLILFVANVVALIVGNLVGHTQKIFDNVGFWSFCYFFSLYLKRWPVHIMNNKKKLFMITCICWCFISGAYFARTTYPNLEIAQYLFTVSTSHTSIPCIVGGYALFFLFLNIKMPSIRLINVIAGGTFGVLLIHDHNFFRPILWKRIVEAETWWYSSDFILLLAAWTLAIFIVCEAIDLVRSSILERWVMNLTWVQCLCYKVDSIIFRR